MYQQLQLKVHTFNVTILSYYGIEKSPRKKKSCGEIQKHKVQIKYTFLKIAPF